MPVSAVTLPKERFFSAHPTIGLEADVSYGWVETYLGPWERMRERLIEEKSEKSNIRSLIDQSGDHFFLTCWALSSVMHRPGRDHFVFVAALKTDVPWEDVPDPTNWPPVHSVDEWMDRLDRQLIARAAGWKRTRSGSKSTRPPEVDIFNYRPEFVIRPDGFFVDLAGPEALQFKTDKDDGLFSVYSRETGDWLCTSAPPLFRPVDISEDLLKANPTAGTVEFDSDDIQSIFRYLDIDESLRHRILLEAL